MIRWRERISLVVQMHRRTEQNLHGFRPKSPADTGQPPLADCGVGAPCTTDVLWKGKEFICTVQQSLTHTSASCYPCFFDHVRTAVEADHMQYCCHRSEDPLIPVLSVYSAAGLVAVDHGAWRTVPGSGLSLGRPSLPARCTILSIPPWLIFTPCRSRKAFFCAFITHVLFLAVIAPPSLPVVNQTPDPSPILPVVHQDASFRSRGKSLRYWRTSITSALAAGNSVIWFTSPNTLSAKRRSA